MNESFPSLHFAITIFIAILMPLMIFLLTRHFAAADRKRDEMLTTLEKLDKAIDHVEETLTDHLTEHRTDHDLRPRRWWR